jgi:hypothetical protein
LQRLKHQIKETNIGVVANQTFLSRTGVFEGFSFPENGECGETIIPGL